MHMLCKVKSENGYGFFRPGLKTGVENGICWSEIGSGIGDSGGTPPPKIPRSTPPRGGGLKRALNPHNANIAVEHLCVGRHHLHLFETYALRSIHFGVFQGAKHLLKR